MPEVDPNTARGKRGLAQEIATRATDPRFYTSLEVLPNPDHVLRKLGKAHEVYDAIQSDAHVIGELRSVRAALLGFEWRLQAGGEAPADQRALQICEAVMSRRPAPGLHWYDIIWTMGSAVFRGYAAHEVVWERQDRILVPAKIIDRPEDRFVFGVDNELRLKTREQMLRGIELGPFKWLVTRHMASYENPYGVALLSACFWPYTFKHSGYKYFAKFAEKYGVPWAVGKYPRGTGKEQQDELTERLAQMVEDAVAAIPDDGSVELIETKIGTSQGPHERLIQACNREMSKALTSQTLATEITGEGSRAASETHRGREVAVNESDRTIIEATFNELFAWISEINVAGARPPTFEFYEEEEARQEWVEVLDTARKYIDIPRQFAHERLQIPMPEAGEETLPRENAPAGGMFRRGHRFAGAAREADDEVSRLAVQAAELADDLIGQLATPVRRLLDEVETLEEFRDGLSQLYPDMDETRIGELTQLAMLAGFLAGMDSVGDG